MTGCSSEGVGVGNVVRARLHDRHLIDEKTLSSDKDWGSCGLLGSRTAQSELVNLNEAPFGVFTECPPLVGRVG